MRQIKNNRKKRIALTEEILLEAIHLHLVEKLSINRISKIVNITPDYLSKKMRKRGIKIVNHQNKLLIRKDIFQNGIEMEADAYWLGFLYADGYISDTGRLELSLKASDYKHLEKFKDFCGFTGNWIKSSNVECGNKIYKRCRLGFATQHLKKLFFKLGIVPRKSSSLKFPNFVKDNLLIHFIRGYIDGDGGFNYYKQSSGNSYIPCLYIIGTESILNGIINYFQLHKNKFLTKSENSKVYQTAYRGKYVLPILHLLYKDADIYLDRKFNKYQEICRLFEKSNR